MVQHYDASGSPAANGAPTQPPSKSDTATPKLNNEVELGDMPNEATQNDIMQMARIGDIVGMEKLFETGDYDATYADDEGITPLHVRILRDLSLILTLFSLADTFRCSGLRSTTSMPCASS